MWWDSFWFLLLCILVAFIVGIYCGGGIEQVAVSENCQKIHSIVLSGRAYTCVPAQ